MKIQEAISLSKVMKPAPSVVQKAASKEELKGMFRQMAEKIPGTKNVWATISKEIESGTITDRASLVKRLQELTK